MRRRVDSYRQCASIVLFCYLGMPRRIIPQRYQLFINTTFRKVWGKCPGEQVSHQCWPLFYALLHVDVVMASGQTRRKTFALLAFYLSQSQNYHWICSIRITHTFDTDTGPCTPITITIRFWPTNWVITEQNTSPGSNFTLGQAYLCCKSLIWSGTIILAQMTFSLRTRQTETLIKCN